MARESLLGGVIDAFEALGVYDVILPFILVFTVVFAILEKTRIFGMTKIEGTEYTKKSLNAMVAFVCAFFVIASSQLVSIIAQVSAQMVILLMLAIFFLLLVGVFFAPGALESDAGIKAWATRFSWLMFVGLLLIFANAIPYSSSQSWLGYILGLFSGQGTNSMVLALLFIIGIAVFIGWMTGSEEGSKK